MKPKKSVRYIALQKAEDFSKKVNSGVIIAADSLIFYKGKPLGKPEDKKEAKEMLRKQSGKELRSLAGLTVIYKDQNETLKGHKETKVKMKRLSEKEIEAYVNTGEPLDKAGPLQFKARARSSSKR